MVAGGKVKSATGLQRSSPKPSQQTQPSSGKQQQQRAPNNNGGSNAGSFTRSFGVYFPRASAQVQPRPPDVSELLRQLEELRERESRLTTELLGLKLVKETAAIVPALEGEIAERDSRILRFNVKIECLEAENERLRNENEFLHLQLTKQNRKFEEKIKCMRDELSVIKRAVEEEESDGSSSSLSISDVPSPNLVDVANNYGESSCNDVADKSLRKSVSLPNSSSSDRTDVSEKEVIKNDGPLMNNDGDIVERPRLSRSKSDDITENYGGGIRTRVPKPPPRPSSSPSSCLLSSPTPSSSYGSLSDSAGRTLAESSNFAPPPPPPPPSQSKIPDAPPPPPPPARSVSSVAPPPPPPPPLKGLKAGPSKVRRIPEVVELYHSLMRRDSGFRRDPAAGGGGAASDVMAKDMIGEIENRSSHLLAIKTDVETQGDFIRSLIKEVECAAFTDIEDVVTFVKWLDDELSFLVDERAVLKHFEWPEHKADALREAAFGYCDLKKLESEVSSFRDDPRQQPCGPALKKMQSLFEKLEHRVYNLSRMRESATNRYKVFRIPLDWMLDTGYVSQIKLASVKLAMKYMKRVSAELGGGGPEDEELILQGVKFAFRVHQFAGGFDMETMKAFQELRDKAQNQHHQRQKVMCRPSSSSLC